MNIFELATTAIITLRFRMACFMVLVYEFLAHLARRLELALTTKRSDVDSPCEQRLGHARPAIAAKG